jgi:hypothetical protein
VGIFTENWYCVPNTGERIMNVQFQGVQTVCAHINQRRIDRGAVARGTTVLHKGCREQERVNTFSAHYMLYYRAAGGNRSWANSQFELLLLLPAFYAPNIH